jgi:hypothetical protein
MNTTTQTAPITEISWNPATAGPTDSVHQAQNVLLGELPGLAVGVITLFYIVSSLLSLV